MKPSIALAERHDAVRKATGRFRTANPRVFGSVLRGTDRDGSDLDLLTASHADQKGKRLGRNF